VSILGDVLQHLLDLGPSVGMPLIVFVLGLVLRMPLGRLIRSALLVGMGFVAINLVVGLVIGALVPASQLMVANVGIHLDAIDAGAPTVATIVFSSSSVVPWIFLLGILMNVVLVALRLTRTLDVDMWNYWHFVFPAAIVVALGGGQGLAIAIGLVSELIALKLADSTGPLVEEVYGLHGVAVPHGETVVWAPLGWLLNAMIDRIPWLNRLEARPADIERRFGLIGEPMVVGAVLGLVIGMLAYYPQFGTSSGTAVDQILTLSITLGAAMLLLPRVVGILMEGLVPLTEAARRFATQHFPDRNLYIGLDAAILMGFKHNISVGLIMVPITLAMAIAMALAGLNRVLPLADLATLPVYAIWATTWSRGNVLRGVIINTIFMSMMLPIASLVANPQTRIAEASRLQLPAGTATISSIDSGAHIVLFVLGYPLLLREIDGAGWGLVIWSYLAIAALVGSYIAYFVRARTHVPGLEDRAPVCEPLRARELQNVQTGVRVGDVHEAAGVHEDVR
jgi:PTS system galactitol-specific IIC component